MIRARCTGASCGKTFSRWVDTWVHIEAGDFLELPCLICKHVPIEVLNV